MARFDLHHHQHLAIGHDQIDFHPVEFIIPTNLKVKQESPTKIIISGIDKQIVGLFASQIREKRPPEPYKGKGIHYLGEVIRRKAGKTGKTGR